MALQTFLLLDHFSKGNGLGVVTLIHIKSASKIYYIQMVSFYDYFIFTTLGILPWACIWQVNVDILDTAFIYDIMMF